MCSVIEEVVVRGCGWYPVTFGLEWVDDPSYSTFQVSCDQRGVKLNISACSIDPSAAAKSFGQCLLHYGILSPFSSGRESGTRVSVAGKDCLYRFLVWRDTSQQSSVVTSCVFSQRVSK